MSKKPRRAPGTAFRDVSEEGGLVVLPRERKIQVLNPVGSKVFSMLDGQHTVDQIVAAVTEEFDVTEAQAREDVESFLGELASAGLIAEEENSA